MIGERTYRHKARVAVSHGPDAVAAKVNYKILPSTVMSIIKLPVPPELGSDRRLPLANPILQRPASQRAASSSEPVQGASVRHRAYHEPSVSHQTCSQNADWDVVVLQLVPNSADGVCATLHADDGTGRDPPGKNRRPSG